MPRLFAGLAIPEEISEELAGLEQPLPGARWIDPDNHHVTLRFFGDVSTRTENDLIDSLANIDNDLFEVRIRGLEASSSREPTAIWASVEVSDPLTRLQAATERAARAAGLATERRKFRPHVTIARLKRSRDEALARFLQRNARLSLGPFVVERFYLFSAKPHTGGGPYVVEQEFALAGGSWDDDDETW